MKKMKKSWMAVLAAMLLVGTLVGVVWARPNDKPQAADITRKVTLSSSAFIPAQPGENYSTSANYVTCTSGDCNLTAQVFFPCLPSVTVERFIIHVLDNIDPGYAVAELRRARPSNGQYVYGLYFTGSPAGFSNGLKSYASAPINMVVWPSQAAEIALYISSPNIWVYGVTVEYHRNI